MNFIPLFSDSILCVGKIKKALFRAIDKYEEANGITDKDLAERIRCDPSLISKYRKGPTRIADLQIEKICFALGLRWQDLDVDTGVKRDEGIDEIIMRLQANPSIIQPVKIIIDGLVGAARLAEERAKGKK